ncbi:RNA-directed DNA polymerase, eukaryota [Tanacetum coccineum]
MDDRWFWDLNGDGVFQVKDVRSMLDEAFLPKMEVPTRWIKSIPIKVNVFAWKLYLDRLPTRSNLSRRNVSLPSLACPLCDHVLEDSSHLFFGCSVAKDIQKLICRWWNLNVHPYESYEYWLFWFKFIRLGDGLEELMPVARGCHPYVHEMMEEIHGERKKFILKGAVPQLIVALKEMRFPLANNGHQLEVEVCGITSIDAFPIIKVDDVITYCGFFETWVCGLRPGSSVFERHKRRQFYFSFGIGPKAISLVLGFGGTWHPSLLMSFHSASSIKLLQTFARAEEEKISGSTSTINGKNVVANRDSRHHNYHVTTSQLSATGHIRRPFARAPSNCKKLSYWVPYCNKTCFGMGEVAWIQGFETKSSSLILPPAYYCLIFQISFKNYNDVPEFERSISGIKEMRPEAYRKLEDAGFEKWSRAYCPANRYNYMTSNCAESINALTKTVRNVPITMLMVYYRDLIQRWYFEHRYTGEDEPLADELSRLVAAKVNQRMLKSAAWTVRGIDRFRVYQVKDNKIVHVVDLAKRECSCLKWQLLGLPCGHVCAMSRCLGMTNCNKWAKA